MGRRSSLSHTPLSHTPLSYTQALEPLIGRAFGAHLSSAEEKAHGAGVGTAARGWVEFATGVADGTGSTGVTDGGRKSPIVSLESLWDGIETMLLLLLLLLRHTLAAAAAAHTCCCCCCTHLLYARTHTSLFLCR